jgi:hypothetical protein
MPTMPKAFNHKQIGSYLAGLWEGDGHITLPVFKDGLTNTPCFAITAPMKDLPLFEKLKATYGGWIRYKNEENAIVWTITARADLFKIIALLNGHLRSPKIYQFNLLIDYLNSLFPNTPLVKYAVDKSDLLTNYWLAGFIDADGGFKIRYTVGKQDVVTGKKTKQRIAVIIKIEQSQFHKYTGVPFKNVMQHIADFFTVNLNTSKHDGVDFWCVELCSFSRMHIIVNYLSAYPLLTAKRNDFVSFKAAYFLIKDQKHLTDSGKPTILELKNSMNRKRTVFDWSHLD